MNTINFYDKQRKLVMQLSDFHTEEEDLDVVSFIGIVNYDFIFVKTIFEAERSDFENFSLSLEKMYKNEQKYVTFNQTDGKITIKIIQKEMGQIDVSIEIFNNLHRDLYTCNVEIKYGMDQSFIPELVKEINEVIKLPAGANVHVCVHTKEKTNENP